MSGGDGDDTKKYARLAARVVRHSVVPFLGAGFSYGAAADGGFATEPGKMQAQLREHLTQRLSRDPPCPPEPERDPAWDTLLKLFCAAKKCNNLGQLAELVHSLLGPSALCEILCIEKYADLRPLANHRLLAYLAREGLIGEVITTNYDTCLETAFRESLPDPADANQCVVVTSLEGYRQAAAEHTAPGHLLIYKINGCAKVYADSLKPDDPAGREAAAKRIILTERQLQTFRGEQWAQDLLRDRARTRTLLFSGFGSEEPQIRHTVLTLMEEFACTQRILRPDQAMDLPNAPFVQVHGASLSFYQAQLLLGFLDSHSEPIRWPAHPNIRLAPAFANVFAGTEKEKLGADAFMLRLFATVFRQRTREAAADDQDLAFWLRAHTPTWRAWLKAVEALAAEKAENVENAEEKDDLLSRLLDDTASKTAPKFPLPLWRQLWRMRDPDATAEPPDYYLSLREEPIQILLTLLCLHLLREDLSSSSTRLIAAQAVSSRIVQPANSADGSRLVRLIAIPARSPPPSEGRWQHKTSGRDGQPDSLRVGRWVVVDIGTIVARAEVPERMADVLSACFAETKPASAARLTPLTPAPGDTP